VAYYYLVASLPWLTLGTEPPLTSADLVGACEGQLSDADMTDLGSIVAGRVADVTHPAFSTYVARDTQLRDALARLRGARVGVDAAPFERPFAGFDIAIERLAVEAMGITDPLGRELALDRYRFKLLEELALPSPFGAIAVLAYAQRLLLAERWWALTEEIGRVTLGEVLEHCTAGIAL